MTLPIVFRTRWSGCRAIHDFGLISFFNAKHENVMSLVLPGADDAATLPRASNNTHLIMAKGNNAHRKEVKKPKKEKPKPAPAGRKS